MYSVPTSHNPVMISKNAVDIVFFRFRSILKCVAVIRCCWKICQHLLLIAVHDGLRVIAVQ
jgi:hypothetical protein